MRVGCVLKTYFLQEKALDWSQSLSQTHQTKERGIQRTTKVNPTEASLAAGVLGPGLAQYFSASSIAAGTPRGHPMLLKGDRRARHLQGAQGKR